jgi:NADPH:quinone reductase-like Zn-dependent oxidoreductase
LAGSALRSSFDPVLGDRFELSLSALEPTGRLVTCGALDSPQVSLNMWAVVGKRSRGGDAYEGRASAVSTGEGF